MSDVTVSSAAVPTVVLGEASNAPAAAPVAAPSATPPAPPASEGKPPWLDERLERAKAEGLREGLKALGFESADDLKKIAAERKAKADAEKTAEEKRIEAESALKKEQKKSQAQAEALGVFVKSQMSALTEAQKAAVMAVAGDDPAQQIKTIEALRPTWTGAETPKLADTGPAMGAPSGAGNVAQPFDVKAFHAELNEINPILAARYAIANGVFEKK